jgi:chloramphenicol-sensitive protein RarD
VTEEQRGAAYGAAAYILWGLFPFYFPLLKPAGPFEIVSHRVVWSLVLCGLVLLVRRRWAWVGELAHDRRRLGLLAVAAAVIAINWGVYIWAVNADHVVDASLGYFINPLVTVLLGVVLLRERLRRAQVIAVGLALIAVLVLAVGYGKPPVIALTLAFSFATYGLVKKIIGMPVLESLTMEAAFLFIPCVVLLAVLQARGHLTFGHSSVGNTLLLMAAGPITAVPLLLFGAGAKRVPLSTMGLLQYITPVIQFLIGVFHFHEALPPARLVGFLLVWFALVIFTIDVLRQGQRTRTLARDEAEALAAS